MTSRVQSGVTAGVAIVGASVLAVAPIAMPTLSAQEKPQFKADIQLSAALTPLEAATIIAEGLAQTGQNAVGAAALSPLSPGVIAIALAAGDSELLYSVIRQSIDAPLWAADPTINALARVLPAPLGGGEADNTSGVDGDGAVVQFRDNVLWAATNAIRTPVRDALGADEPAPGENPVATIGAGLGESAVRFVEGAALAPLGLISIAQAIATGDKADLYLAIRQYIDAPLWVADPSIDAVADVVDTETGAEINRFRDETLWGATFRVRETVANALGVDVHIGDQSPTSLMNVEERELNSATDVDDQLTPYARTPGTNNRVLGNANLGKFAPGSNVGSGNTLGFDESDDTVETDDPRPGRAAVKAFNDHVKASTERFNQTVRKLAGADDRESNTEGGTTGGGTAEGGSTTD